MSGSGLWHVPAYLRARREPIEVRYLDRSDTTASGFAKHVLAELEAAYDKPGDASVVLIDDDAYARAKWAGKGALISSAANPLLIRY